MANSKTYREIEVSLGNLQTKVNFRHAKDSKGLIIFSHGSDRGSMSTGTNYIAEYLLERGFSSLLFDLLTVQEHAFYENRCDISLLTSRLLEATEWIKEYVDVKNTSIGYFGTSIGTASALIAAAQLGNKIKAVVSRDGRPDLAYAILPYVKSPLLLMVGGKDSAGIDFNLKAQEQITGICELKIIEGAKHWISVPEKLNLVAEETVDWFHTYL